MLTPAFHFEILKQFVPVFESVGKIFVDKLGKCQSASVDLQPLVSLCTLDVISGKSLIRGVKEISTSSQKLRWERK
jgi:hypothetical protein